MKTAIRPLWITRNAKTGKVEGITTRKPTAAALAKIGAPVEIEITTRPPKQEEMEFTRDVFALVPTYCHAPTRTTRTDHRQQALSI
jgi:hypothetical protein